MHIGIAYNAILGDCHGIGSGEFRNLKAICAVAVGNCRYLFIAV